MSGGEKQERAVCEDRCSGRSVWQCSFVHCQLIADEVDCLTEGPKTPWEKVSHNNIGPNREDLCVWEAASHDGVMGVIM